MMEIKATVDLSRLADPFPAEDIEWRVFKAGVGKRGVFCKVLAYVTARAIANRLDAVCGPQGWQITQPVQYAHDRRCAMGIGISIRVNGEWITKWDVCELTDGNQSIPPFKGGVSGAIKRAGAQWGIFRYGYYLEETYAEVSDDDPAVRGWHYATLPKNDGRVFYWKEPRLPSWALPKEETEGISLAELNGLKTSWRNKFGEGSTSRADLAEGFSRFVTAIVGTFPFADHTCWTKDALTRCQNKIDATTDPGGISADVPFGE